MSPDNKVIFFIGSISKGGASRVLSRIVRPISERGFSVKVVSLDNAMEEGNYKFEGAEVIFLSSFYNPSSLRFANRVKKILAIRKILSEDKNVVAVSFLNYVNVALVLAAVFLKNKVIVSERTSPSRYMSRVWERKFYGIVYSRADYVVVQTDRARLWFERNIPKSNPIVIPNPVEYPVDRGEMSDVENVAKQKILSERSKVVLSVGRLERVKRFDILIGAFSLSGLRDDGYKLVIIGEGGEESSLRDVAISCGVDRDVFFLGGSKSLDYWYSISGMYVLSSEHEGFPNSLLEAAVYEVPLVAFDIEFGPSDIIEHGCNGLLIEVEGGEVELSKAMRRLAYELPVKKGKGKVDCLRDSLSRKKIADAWLSLF